MRKFLRDQFGQSMVEMALSLPIMVFLLLGGADMARAFAIQLAVQNGARAGAEAYAIDFTPTSAETILHAQQEMNRTPGMDASLATITVTRKQGDGITNCIASPDILTPCFATVRVQFTFRTIIAWPLIPNVYNFDRRTTMRTFV
ncbi:MAG: pilus assembly protein [Chloroflexota bacterium]|nr:pilus assembly protein [Chloroflexota bacterium]